MTLSDAQADALITEDWLKEIGFKWHQIERQPERHWLLWLGSAMNDRTICFEDLGIEVASGAMDDAWFCWLRGDVSHRYSRFIHLRHIRTKRDLIQIIEGITGQTFDLANCLFGMLHTADRARQLRAEHEKCEARLDRVLLRDGHPWREEERDESRGRPTIEHKIEAERAAAAERERIRAKRGA